jgi:succinate dehydrogenase / fumarate reductase membrane anchor subunit
MADMRTPLNRVRGLGSAREGTEHFWRQRLTALSNIPLTLFMIWLVMSLSGADHAEARALLGNPFVALAIILFLGSATYHMRIGMQVIIEDYIHGELLKVSLLALNTFFAVVVAAAGTFAVLKMAFGG